MPEYKFDFIRRFAEIGMDDVALVGGKNAFLGALYRELSRAGVKVPNGFAVTADAYRDFVAQNVLHERIADALARVDVADVDALAKTSVGIRRWILEAKLPPDLQGEICDAYEELAAEYGFNPDVAVRSSATAEDLPEASFAGQQETYLHVRGGGELLDACRRVFASLFTARAIAYRRDQGFDHMSVALSVGVQKMVRADVGASGVMFTLDTESGFRDVVFITAAYGLGETVVQGEVIADEFYVFKPTLERRHRPILRRHLGDKAIKLVYDDANPAGTGTHTTRVAREDRRRFAISDDEVLELARAACAIEEHYSHRAGRAVPMDIDWAKDGVSGDLFIVQACPETVHAAAAGTMFERFVLAERGKVVATGKSVGHRNAAGRARIILKP